MKLFHFSDDPNIEVFTPRAVQIPSKRAPGCEWLNGPLVWAIDEIHQAMYLFPRDCPRILLWPKPDTTLKDREQWWAGRSCRAIAHIEWAWFERIRAASIYRYELPQSSFENLNDAGMWVCRTPIVPNKVDIVQDLPAEMRALGVELRIMESLVPLKGAWETSLHVSGIRLRNAQGWENF